MGAESRTVNGGESDAETLGEVFAGAVDGVEIEVVVLEIEVSEVIEGTRIDHGVDIVVIDLDVGEVEPAEARQVR